MAYDFLGQLAADLRERVGLTQAELAEAVGVSQQTVSRWEAGRSRPSREMIFRLSDLLGSGHREELLQRAAYSSDDERLAPAVRPLLTRLPLANLSPSDFEAFCRDFIKLRHGASDVHRFGHQGHRQDGIDLVSHLPNGRTVTYQCKRVKQFGPARVKAAVDATRFEASEHHLLLSRPASPDARKEIGNHRKWMLEDVEDISSAVRFELASDDARRLVDTYFPGLRRDFLGISSPSIWLTDDEFFRPTLKPTSILSHEWHLVGREGDLDAIDRFLSSDSTSFVISGRGGAGKSRFMRAVADHVAASAPTTAVRFLAPDSPFRPEEIEHLPDGPVVLMVDDAHDRDDIGLLLATLARSGHDIKLILATRPYGRDRLLAELRTQGLTTLGDDPNHDLEQLALDHLVELASAVLERRGGSTEAAPAVARATRDCPLFTVIAAQLVAAGRADPYELVRDETARSFLLRGFRDAIVGGVGDPSEATALGETLRLVALIQPVIADTDEFRSVCETVLGQRPDRALRYLRTLEEAGVLMRRGRQLRVVPDLLGEFLIADSCVDPRTGYPTGYADLVFSAARGEVAQNVIMNIAKLDWRAAREHKGDSRVLDRIWDSLTNSFHALGIFGREALLKALSDVSYYQPRRALELARMLIHNPTDEIDISRRLLPSRPFSYDHVLAALPQFLRGAALHVEFVGEVCDVLWSLGRNQPGTLHALPEHAVRILQDLASIEPRKPLEFLARIINRTIAWTRDPDLGTYAHSPLDVMEVALATEGYITEWRGWTLNMTPFLVPVEAMRPLRNRVVDTVIGLLDNDDVRVGARAAQALAEALRYPVGMLGKQVSQRELDQWTPEFVYVLERIAERVRDTELDPIVEDLIRRAVNWHAKSSGATKEPALEVLTRLDAGFKARVTRALAHGWAHSAELPEEDDLDYAELERTWRESQRAVAHELLDRFRDPVATADLLEERLAALALVNADTQPSPGPFLALVCEASQKTAAEILMRVITQSGGAFGDYAHVILLALRGHPPEDGAMLSRRLVATGEPTLAVQAAIALTRAARPDSLTAEEMAVIEELAQNDSSHVRLSLASGLRFASGLEKPLRLVTVLKIAIRGVSSIAEEVLGNFGRHGDFQLSDLSKEQITYLLDALLECEDIEDYQIGEFLAALSAMDPGAVLTLLQRRIDYANEAFVDARYRPVPYRWDDSSPLRFRHSPEFVRTVQRICNWLLEPDEGWQREFWAPHLFTAVVVKIDDTVLDVLSDWAGASDPSRLEVVSHVFQNAPRDLVWTRVDWVRDLLDHAYAISYDCYSKVAGGLHSAVVSGGRRGKPGEPFPEDIEQRDRSRDIAVTLPPGSPTHRFYTNLVKSAEASIRSTIARHEEERPN